MTVTVSVTVECFVFVVVLIVVQFFFTVVGHGHLVSRGVWTTTVTVPEQSGSVVHVGVLPRYGIVVVTVKQLAASGLAAAEPRSRLPATRASTLR